MNTLKKVNFHSSLVKNPNCTYWGVNPTTSFFEFANTEIDKTLVIRFDDMPWKYGIVDEKQFMMAEVFCHKTGDTLLQTQLMSKAKQLIKDFTNN